MTELPSPAAASLGRDPGDDLRTRLEALRARAGVDDDPIGFCVLEAMLRRLDAFEGAAQTALRRRIEHRLTAFQARCERSGSAARIASDHAATGSAAAVVMLHAARVPDEMGETLEPGKRGGLLRRLEAGATEVRAERGSLAQLLAHVARHSGAVLTCAASAAAGGEAEPTAELKSLRYFRSTWSRLSLEQQLSRALAQAPDNAGPLNSHFLVLQALIRMRDIAPQYLEAFIAQVDALLWLEQADAGRGAANRSAAQKAGARKGEAPSRVARAQKSVRGKAG